MIQSICSVCGNNFFALLLLCSHCFNIVVFCLSSCILLLLNVSLNVSNWLPFVWCHADSVLESYMESLKNRPNTVECCLFQENWVRNTNVIKKPRSNTPTATTTTTILDAIEHRWLSCRRKQHNNKKHNNTFTTPKW